MSETDVQKVMERAARAAAVFSQLDQERTDRVVRAVYEAGFRNRVRLAHLAHEETGIGKWPDKVLKNVIATQLVYDDIKDVKTVGVVSDDAQTGIVVNMPSAQGGGGRDFQHAASFADARVRHRWQEHHDGQYYGHSLAEYLPDYTPAGKRTVCPI